MHRYAEMIALRSDRSERHVGSLFREVFPVLAVRTTTLRVDRLRAADCEHEQRAEHDRRREIAIDDEMHGRPHCRAPQKRMPRDAHYAARLHFFRELPFTADCGRIRCRDADDDKRDCAEYEWSRERLEPGQSTPQTDVRCD